MWASQGLVRFKDDLRAQGTTVPPGVPSDFREEGMGYSAKVWDDAKVLVIVGFESTAMVGGH